MPEVLDSLFVEIGLDPTKFTEGQKKALASFKKTQDEALKVAKDVEASGRRMAEFFGGIKNAAVGLFTVLAGTDMVRFARDVTTTVSATGRLAYNIGASTKDLATFAAVVERNGGSAEEAKQSLMGLTQQAEQFRVFGQASQQFQIALGTIGASAADTALDMYMKFADWASKNRNNPEFVNLIGRQLGLDQGSINASLIGAQKLRQELEESRRFAPSQADVTVLQDLQQNWGLLDQALNAVGRDLVVQVSGPFDSFAKGAADWIAKNRQVADSIAGITAAFVALSAFKPAAWLLRLLGLGAAAGGAAAATGVAIVPGEIALSGVKTFEGLKAGRKVIYEDPFSGGVILGDLPGGETAAPAASPSSASTRQKVMSYFMAQGWSREDAAALAANAFKESSFNPKAGVGTAHQGLFQWDAARRAQILHGTGIDVWNSGVDAQLRAAQWELTHTEAAAGAGLRKQSGAGAKAIYLDRYYERSGDTASLEQGRALLASQWAHAGGDTNVDSDVSIGTINVNAPNATDADAISKGIGEAIKQRLGSSQFALASVANTGMR